MFSLVDQRTISSVETKWIPEIYKHTPKTPFIFCGTKLDLVNDESIHKYLEQHDESVENNHILIEELKGKYPEVSYFEISSYEKINVKEMFFGAIGIAKQFKEKKDCIIS